MTDKIIKALALDGRVLITLADTRQLSEKIKQIHDLTPTTTAIAGRLATIMTMMVHTSIKEEQNSITAQIKGNGPVGSIVTVGNLENDIAKIKLYMQDTKVELQLKENGKIDVSGAIGKTGYLNVIKENKNDYVIIDTAGRLQIDDKLMLELKSIEVNFFVNEKILVLFTAERSGMLSYCR